MSSTTACASGPSGFCVIAGGGGGAEGSSDSSSTTGGEAGYPDGSAGGGSIGGAGGVAGAIFSGTAGAPGASYANGIANPGGGGGGYGGEPPRSELAVFGLPLRAVAHVRREDLGVRRERRIAVVERQGTPRLYVAPVEAWIAAWRLARADGVQLHLFETITDHAVEHALGTDLAHAS